MRRVIFSCFIILLLFENLRAQTNGISLSMISNYRQWGWNAVVIKNDFITMATMPAIGGRVMQYDLDTLPSLYINPDEFGHTYIPSKNNPWYNFGGYKTWPSPQYRWPNTWPPPPTLDYGSYSSQVDTSSTDSVSITVTSPVETWIATGVQFQRKATLYKGTTRVKMEQTMTNTGSTIASWGMWSVWQTNVHHSGKTDYANYRAYFPLNANSIYGSTGVKKPDGNSSAWLGPVADGVYGVGFTADNKKIFADPDKGWIAYTSISDSVVFARTFSIYEGAHYPDSARTTVYVSASSPTYMEVEVKGPIVDLPPYNGSSTFTENWWAAKVRSPILDVNSVGASAQHLVYDSAAHCFSGIYGVFYNGILRTVLFGSDGDQISTGLPYKISPRNEVQLRDTMIVPNNAATAQIQIYDTTGVLIGVLDSLPLLHKTTEIYTRTTKVPAIHLFPNYPNPFNPATTIEFSIAQSCPVMVDVFTVLGKKVTTLINRTMTPGTYSIKFDGSQLPSGVYFYRLSAGAYRETHKLVLLK